MSFQWVRRIPRNVRRAWAIGAGVVVIGTAVKSYYFYYSRGVIIEDMDRTHLKATKNLNEAREFAEWSTKDRESRLPPLTEEQKKQLQNYLTLMAENNPKVFPENSRRR
jgi:hypothetical protein